MTVTLNPQDDGLFGDAALLAAMEEHEVKRQATPAGCFMTRYEGADQVRLGKKERRRVVEESDE